MRHKLPTIAALLATFFVLSAIPGFSAVADTIIAKVPFSFYVGQTRLPAGQYEISSPTTNSYCTLLIRQVNGDRSILVMAMPASLGFRTAPKTELIFDKVGNQEFLRQVWERGNQNGDEFLKAKAEREMLAQAGVSHLSQVDAFPIHKR